MSDEHDSPDRSQNLLDEFIAEDEILDEVISEAAVFVKSTIEVVQQEASDHRFRPRKHINRPREEAHQKLN
jgi:predicted alpha/beta-hydrolase family hydrolase